jgi:hypothetical protein
VELYHDSPICPHGVYKDITFATPHTHTHTHTQYEPTFIHLGRESRSYYEMAYSCCPFGLHFDHNFQKSLFSYLYVKGLWRFSILHEIQAVIISNRLHVVCKRLTVFIEPQNLQQYPVQIKVSQRKHKKTEQN